MRFYGQIVDLRGFLGHVQIQDNTFQFNTVKYQDCDAAYKIMADTNDYSSSDPYESYGSSKDKIQIKSVISVTDHHHDFYLIGNTFTRNTGTKGIVYLDLHDRTNYPLIISDNDFASNGGYVDASVLHITLRAPASKTPGTTIPNNPGNYFCGNVDISHNQFTGNYGCGQAVGGVLRFQCIGYGDSATGKYDQHTPYTIGDVTTANAASYIAIDETTANFPDTTTTVQGHDAYLYKFVFQDNTLT